MNRFREIEKKIEELCRHNNVDRVVVLTDSNVMFLIDSFLASYPHIIVKAGEESKSLHGAETVWCAMEKEGLTRRSALVNVGGGMVSDLGGFAASTFKRGIKCINVPTTLLAAVDAAIGGKTGINFAGLKNEIGTFSLPIEVMPLTSLFASLPENEWLSGVGEAIKTGLLDSEELFELATSEAFIVERNPDVVDEVVARCSAFKQKIVGEDFREGSKRKILNLGHTAGHAIESLMMEKGTPIPHGIAVAHGIRIALEESLRLPDADGQLLSRYKTILEKYFPKIDISEEDKEKMTELMGHDKKNVMSGTPSWVLLPYIGHPIV